MHCHKLLKEILLEDTYIGQDMNFFVDESTMTF